MIVRYIGRRYKKSDYFFHVHEGISELFVITSGTGLFVVNNKEMEVKENDIIFCPQNIFHTGPGGDCGLIFIMADIILPKDMKMPFVIQDKDNVMRGIFEMLQRNYVAAPLDSNYKNYEAMLCEMLFNMAFDNCRTLSWDFHVKQLCDVIQNNFSNPNFALGSEMEKIFYSVPYLRKKFIKALGVSPIKYLNNLRIDYAKKLMANDKEKKLSLSQISLKCGFNDERYFSRVFKQYCNVTPREFRNECFTY